MAQVSGAQLTNDTVDMQWPLTTLHNPSATPACRINHQETKLLLSPLLRPWSLIFLGLTQYFTLRKINGTRIWWSVKHCPLGHYFGALFQNGTDSVHPFNTKKCPKGTDIVPLWLKVLNTSTLCHLWGNYFERAHFLPGTFWCESILKFIINTSIFIDPDAGW